MTLEELIARQRFMLNRTTLLARKDDSAWPDPTTAEQCLQSETTLADAALMLAQYLESKGNFRCAFLYDAEKEMRKTIERFGTAELNPANKHQSEALALLIKARDAIRIAFGKSPPSEATRRFDREQAQKLRRPKKKDDQAELLAQQLRKLADEEEFVYATLGGLPADQGSPSNLTAQSQNAANTSRTSQSSPQSREGQAKSAQESNPDQKDVARQPSDSPGQTGNEARGPRDLKERQRDIVLDAYEAEKLMAALGDMTELARSRMRRGTEDAEQASDALARGDKGTARDAAGKAGGVFRELAQHVEGLTARDVAGKLGAARDLSVAMAERQRGLANRLDQEPPPGSPSSGPTRETGSGGKDPRLSSAGERQGVSPPVGKGPTGEKRGDSGTGGDQRDEGSKGRGAHETGEQPSDSASGRGSRDGTSEGNGGRETGDQPGDSGNGHGTRDGTAKGRGDREPGDAADGLARLAERGRTLQDLLDSLARNAEADRETSGRVAAARERARLDALVRVLDEIRQRLRGQQPAGGTAAVRESADRLEVLAQELDALHGTVVAPRLSELIALEKQAARLGETLARLASDPEISKWHLDVQQLLQAIEKAEAGGTAVDALREAMTAAGWNTSRTHWGWTRDVNPLGGHQYYVAPGLYVNNLTRVAEDLQRQTRELLLRDLMAAGQEAVPPQYEKLVERYFEMLSREKKPK